MSCKVIPIVEGYLYGISNTYLADGRVSTCPPSYRGHASINCYVLLEPGEALLIDCGLSVHQQQLTGALERLIGDRKLCMWPMRFGEFNALCNARPIADRFHVAAVYAPPVGAPSEWLDFRPEYAPFGTLGVSGLDHAEPRTIGAGSVLELGDGGLRLVDVVHAPVRLLPTFWAYDRRTRTLFSADFFTWAEKPHGRVPEELSQQQRCRYLLEGNRYWWLRGADTSRLRAGIKGVFERFEVENIAPAYGPVVSGSAAVAAQTQLIDEVLADAASDDYLREPAA